MDSDQIETTENHGGESSPLDIDLINSSAENGKVLKIEMPECFGHSYLQEIIKKYDGTHGKYSRYEIDFKYTKEVESCMFGVLLQMNDYLVNTNARIHLINCNKEIKSILLFALPLNIFEIY